ncbi:hypothetical protein ACHQM5_028673 [Ranunculus cassubicifolius]
MDEHVGYEAIIKDPEIGMSFPTVKDCRSFLKDYAIFNRFEYHLDKNDPDRIRATCIHKEEHGCPWLFYARVSGAKKADKHTCTIQGLQGEHSLDCLGNPMYANWLADSDWVAKKLLDQFKVHHRVWKSKNLEDEVWFRYGVNITYWVAWYARIKMLEKVFGNYERSYELTPSCCWEVLRRNPRSIATVSRDSVDETFTGMCISFKASLLGWLEGCRPILGLDGCHLKGKYGGVCLSITGLDGNNGLFPIAIYICRGEDAASWRKFLEIMEADLTDHPSKLTFMSDQQKGLKEVIQQIFPGANHRFCFRHMYQNFKKDNKGGKALETLVWGAARAYKKVDCDKWMKQLKDIDAPSHAWLMARDQNTWCRSTFDTSTYCEHITNNFSESFNAWIHDLRDRTPTGFVEHYCLMMMTQMWKRQVAARKMDMNGLLPRVHARLKHLEGFIKEYTYQPASDYCFSVQLQGGSNRWLVNLERKTCDCRVWQITGIPCVHAVLIIKLRKLGYHRYVFYCILLFSHIWGFMSYLFYTFM